jgi:type IV secretory pathway component VirB8
MAEKSGRNRSTGELRAEIADSRERVARDLRGLHYELDFPRKLRRSFREQTVSWITAAAAVGTLIVLLPVRKKKIYVDKKSGRKSKKRLVETGFALGALKIGASLLRPVIVDLVKNRLADTARLSRASKK